MKRASYHHGNLRSALIASGLEILRRQGVEGLTLRKAAARAGVSHTAPYRHFSGKDGLLAAIALDGFQKLSAALETIALDPRSDFRGTLSGAARAYLAFARENPGHMALMFSGERVRLSRSRPMGEPPVDAFKPLVEIIDRGRKEGLIRDDLEPRTLALIAWSTVHGLALLNREEQFDGILPKAEGMEALVTSFVDVFLAGARAR